MDEKMDNPFGEFDEIVAAALGHTESEVVKLVARQNGKAARPLNLMVFVPGSPKPQGSKDYKGKRKNGSAILTESADVKPWRYAIAQAVRADGTRLAGAVHVETWFVLHRPLSAKKGQAADKRPDGDKLTRAVWDALTEAQAIEDDARIVSWTGGKRLAEDGELTGVHIVVRPAGVVTP